MTIETLQIKRVTGHWDTHKTTVPENGELVFIDVDSDNKTIVIGDGSSTLEALKTNELRAFVSLKKLHNILNEHKNDLIPTSNTENITKDSSSKGDSGKFAYSNHKHKLEKNVVESILETNSNFASSFNVRRVMIDGSVNGPSSTTGSDGDICIRV